MISRRHFSVAANSPCDSREASIQNPGTTCGSNLLEASV